jgi:hypothetical protein
MLTRRTFRDFTVDKDIWHIVDNWARMTKFRVKQMGKNWKLLQKGTGFLVAPMMLEIGEEKGKVHLEAWVRCNFLIRLMALFMLPAEMGIESGGFRGVAPRRIARNAVNQLLLEFKQPLIP